MGLEKLFSSFKKGFKNAVKIVALSAFLYSCPPITPEPEPEPDEPETEIQIAENVTMLSDYSSGNIFFVDEDTVIFSEQTNETNSLSQGDIIVSDITPSTPQGLLRKITNISQDKLTLETEKASLEEIANNYSITEHVILNPILSRSTKSLEGVISRASTEIFDFNLDLTDVVLYDIDDNPFTTDDQILANGNISFNSYFLFNLKIKDFNLEHLGFKNVIDEELNINVTSPEIVSNIDKTIKIKDFYFNPFVLAYTPTTPPIPIIVTPKLSVDIRLTGDIIQTSLGLNQNAYIELGLSYDDGEWESIKRFDNEFGFQLPTSSQQAYFAIRPIEEFSLCLYDTLGPYGSLEEYLSLFSYSNGNWNLYAGVIGDLGIKMQMFGKNLLDYNKTIIDYSEILASGEGEEEPPEPIEVIIQPGPEGEDAHIKIIYWPDGSESYSGEGDEIYLNVDREYLGRRFEEALIKFPLSSIPNNSTIILAKLGLYGRGAFSMETARVYAERIISPWNESTVEWDTKPRYGEIVTSSNLSDEVKWHEWDVTSLVQKWINGESNHGIALTTSSNRPWEEHGFKSSDYSVDPTKRPRLVINYLE